MNFFEAIKIHLRLGLLIVFLVPTVSWIIALAIVPIYESRARLLIEAKDLGFEGPSNQPFKSIAKLSDPIQTQIEILRSATILDKVIRQFNMRYKDGPQKGQYLNYLTLNKEFNVSADKNVDIVELKYKDPDPKQAKDILQAITDSYIEKTIELKASDTASAIRFLKKERNKAEREALDSSKRLREFENRSKTISIEGNQEVVKNIYGLKDQKLAVNNEYLKAKSTTEELSKNSLNPELTKSLLQAKADEVALMEQLTVIDRAIAELQEKIDRLPNEKYIYTQLVRQNEVAQKRLEEIETKLIESRMKGVIASHITNIRLIDPPSLSTRPKWPNIPLTLLASFIFGLCLAVIVVYLVEYFDDVIKNVDTLPQEMPCPFLGQLPRVHMGDLPVVYQEPRSEYTEAVHALRTNLSFLSLSGDRKLLLITSPSTSEGKSTAAVNLAITYAQSGKRVLLVDADIRNPSLYKYLARPKDAIGISNTLINEIDFYDVVQKSILGIVGFDYLPGGDVPPNPVQLLESDKMKELLETSEHIYDLVILDTPPLGLFSDALLLARYADVVALVAKYNKTSRKELTAAINLLTKTNVAAMGVILNAVPTGGEAYGYRYDYSDYGSDKRDKFAKGQSAA